MLSGVAAQRSLKAITAGFATLVFAASAHAQAARIPFEQWSEGFRARALARGISAATYARVMRRLEPDISVFDELHDQPEFNEQLWQYLNRRVSEWRIVAGKEKLTEYAPLLSRIQK